MRRSNFWSFLIVLLGLACFVGSIFYFRVLLVKDIPTDDPGGGMCTYLVHHHYLVCTAALPVKSYHLTFVGFSGPHIHSGSKSSKSDNSVIYKLGLEYIDNEIDTALHDFLRDLNWKFQLLVYPGFEQIWAAYMEAAELHLVPLDAKTKMHNGLFPVKEDKSIFISIVSYGKDECPTMLKDIYSKALHPEKVAVGLIQENFVSDDDTTGDEDDVQAGSNSNCYSSFCSTDLGKPYCDKKAIRLLQMDEKESLGPNVERYLAAKLWRGENFFFQIDSNFNFGLKWDESLIKDMSETPTYPKSVLSYHPATFADEKDFDFNLEKDTPQRICSARFPEEQFPVGGPDSDIIYLDIDKKENSAQKSSKDGKPCRTAFLRSSFIFAHGDMLSTLPFDPFVPWLSMGAETVLSMRMWTWGFDFYGPTKSVVGYYPDYPPQKRRKIWEISGHFLESQDTYFEVTAQVIQRVKYILQYPESSKAVITVNSNLEVLIHQVWFCETDGLQHAVLCV